MANKNELKHPTLENETQMGQIPINDCKEAITSTQKNAGSHALVIGGSIAGLFAARVLADYFETVTILDHDIFPVTPDHRKGVPQSYHAHGLLATAFPILEQLFPGIMNDLRASGAATAFNTVPVAIVTPKGLLPLPKNPGESIAFSRPLLEWHMRRYVSKRSEVHIIVNTEVIGLSVTQDRTRVIGIKMRERGLEGRITTMHADLVVDASGRHSKAPQWLVELGYEAPPVETINSNLRYASRFYAKPEEFPAEWQSLIVSMRPPHENAGIILSVDHERWHVTLGGMAGNIPPTDEEGFLQFARDLPDPSIYEALRIAQPLTPIRGYGTQENHFRHFERMHRWPNGFVVTGDAVCAFNPIYGQGMTVSSLDAMILKRCLQEQQRSPIANFEQHFQQQLAPTIADAWLLATNQDLRWPPMKLRGANHIPVLRLLHRYLDLVLFSAIVDPEIAQAYFNVLVLATPPRSLVRPRIVVHVLKVAFKRAVKRLFWGQEDAGFGLSQEALSMLRSRAGKSSKPVSFIERHERKVRFRTRTMMPDKPTE
jgi:2-polyprenyl-6-methoxyphenol hydroxylase-like FAD-dependent oxidoreductase